jgi:hypothetical protein
MRDSYKVGDIINTVQSSYLSMVAILTMGVYLHRFGESHVIPNLTNIQLGSNYFISKDVQKWALKKKLLENFALLAPLRGVFSAMYEGMKNNVQFENAIKSVLGAEYEPFFGLVNLLRNVYAHELTGAAHSDIMLKKKDFEGFVRYRQDRGMPMEISLNVKYCDICPAWANPPEGYGVNLKVSLLDLAEGKPLSSVISKREQQMLAELCLNLCTGLIPL